MIEENKWPVVKEGLPFLIPMAFITLLSLWMGWKILTIFGIFITLFIAFFFRNPKRRIPIFENAILCPADGRVIYIGECEENRFLKQRALKVSIFMSPLDVHLNRSPVTGKVINTSYQKGRFMVASREKSSSLNEQNAILLEAEDRSKILLVQIAGFFARRIVCHARVGSILRKGEIFGMIRFGSRVDIYIPVEIKPIIRIGEHVRAGESIIGYRE